MRRKAILLILTMAASLLLASGGAFAVNKVCPQNSTNNPTSPTCVGTKKTKTSSGNDLLIGNGYDWITALSGNDKIAGGLGNDTTDGGAGNDTYSYVGNWGTDTVVDASGVDTLNFSAVSGDITAGLYPEFGANTVTGPGGTVNVSLDPRSVIEKVVGSASGYDYISTGGAANILQPGPGTGGASLWDYGGYPSIPVSNDTYSGFLASGFGEVTIRDYRGTADKLILPFASTDAYFVAFDYDGDGIADTLSIIRTSTDAVYIEGQLQPFFEGATNVEGHIETIRFTDGNLSIGSASATSANTASSSDGGTSQVDALNTASTLSASKKDELAKAAKKIMSKAPNK